MLAQFGQIVDNLVMRRLIANFLVCFAIGLVFGMALHIAAATAAPLSQPTTFVLHPPPNWSPQFTSRVERQIEHQVATQVSSHWAVGQPWVTTQNVPGIQIWFESGDQVEATCEGPAEGCHLETPQGPEIVASRDVTAYETITVDHEILETLVDPYWSSDPTMLNGQLVEICDPMEEYDYESGGVFLSTFVYPSYFTQTDPRIRTSYQPHNLSFLFQEHA